MNMSAVSGITAPRRVLATRNAGWARRLVRQLAERGVRPNPVSVLGVGFAALAAGAFAASSAPAGSRVLWLIGAAVAIQLRLVCNLVDGMLAIEEGLEGKTGAIFNDLPDRLSDVVILVGAGYGVPDGHAGPALGWAASVAAVLTAYVRVLAGSLGLAQHFVGPMAKPHRMFVLTVACLLAAVETIAGLPARALAAGLAVILVGALLTTARRTVYLLREARDR